jgi:TonB family protein
MKKKEFSFTIALSVALLLHAVLGIFLKYNPLVAATPAMPLNAKPPVTLRFVDVPQNAKSVQAPIPSAKYASDANRKAGPLVPNKLKPQQPKIPQYASSKGSSGSRSQAVQRPMPPQPQPSAPEQQQSTTPPGQTTNDPAAVPAPKLAEGALNNLDRYLGGSSSGSGSGNGNDDEIGSMPAGDPGSGVFFDTQGYDLGPWANRVIAMVKRNWIVPVAADLGLKGIVGISFQVDRNGKILNPTIISSSQVPSYDQAALQALMISDPFPPLPADFPRPKLPAVFRFYYNTPVNE